MAEEIKKDQEKTEDISCTSGSGCSSKSMLKMILGIVLCAFGVVGIVVWWPDLLSIIRGCIGLILVLAGAITIAIARD